MPGARPSFAALRSARDIAALDRAAAVARSAVRAALAACLPGATTRAVGMAARDRVLALGGRCAFEGYRPAPDRPAFPHAACVCVNEQVVHAPPGDRELQPGDLVTIDVGVELDGWHGDVASSVLVPGAEPGPAARLLGATRRAVAAATLACRPGARWSSATAAARRVAERAGLALLPGYSGHGIGETLHQPPRAGFDIGAGDADDFVLWPGMVLTIEPILMLREVGVVTLADGWTVRTRDGSTTCHEERVVAVTRRGPRILGLRRAGFGEGSGL